MDRRRDVPLLRGGDSRHHLLGGQRTRTAAHFYAAGGGITGLQNGLAIAGDYMSAASFLGISAFVYACGYDGLIYSVGFLVGWPFITFLIAEPLRNLGRFTSPTSSRIAFKRRRSACWRPAARWCRRLLSDRADGRRGQLIQLLFGRLKFAVVGVGVLMVLYVTFGGMIATTWVQIIKAGLLLGGATLIALLCPRSSASIRAR